MYIYIYMSHLIQQQFTFSFFIQRKHVQNINYNIYYQWIGLLL